MDLLSVKESLDHFSALIEGVNEVIELLSPDIRAAALDVGRMTQTMASVEKIHCELRAFRDWAEAEGWLHSLARNV